MQYIETSQKAARQCAEPPSSWRCDPLPLNVRFFYHPAGAVRQAADGSREIGSRPENWSYQQTSSGEVHRGDALDVVPRRGYSKRVWAPAETRWQLPTARQDHRPRPRALRPPIPALGSSPGRHERQTAPPTADDLISAAGPRSIPPTPHARLYSREPHTQRFRGPVSWRMLPNDVISAVLSASC